MRKYDFLIVGAGLYGAVFAQEATKRGKRCLVIDRRVHVGGNAYTEEKEGILIHRYGAHIFHTADPAVWDYVSRFATFRPYLHSPLAEYHGEIYHLPFNMHTFSEMWGIKTPEEAKRIIASQIKGLPITTPNNLEEQALLSVGRDIYEKLVKGYTEKQWGKPCSELPPFLIKRLPLRFTYDNNYFNDPFQGIPEGGYTPLVEKLLKGSEVLLETDYFSFVKTHPNIADRTVYSGEIDRFFDYRFGALAYRSLRFETERLSCPHHQPCAVVNHTAKEVPYTRTIEHKYFEDRDLPHTFVTREYSAPYRPGGEPYYPINDSLNNSLYEKYRELKKTRPDVIFGGRLGSYAYLDMDQTIKAALQDSEKYL